LGASGKERTSAINFFFKQIIDLNVPIHMKYLLWTAAEGINNGLILANLNRKGFI